MNVFPEHMSVSQILGHKDGWSSISSTKWKKFSGYWREKTQKKANRHIKAGNKKG